MKMSLIQRDLRLAKDLEGEFANELFQETLFLKTLIEKNADLKENKRLNPEEIETFNKIEKIIEDTSNFFMQLQKKLNI